LAVNEAVVIHNSNKLSVRLLPCDVFARVALVGQEVSAQVELARHLAGSRSPVAALDPRVEPRVYEDGGFAVTLWTYYEAAPADQVSPEYADALRRLHAGMRGVQIATPHYMERIERAGRLVADQDETPALAADDRDLLLSTLQSVCRKIRSRGAAEQLLHGEPHPGNILGTRYGALFVDFKTCCRGPVEFDVAHVPDDVSVHYPDVDQVLLEQCRRLVLALVAAWRWDVRDQFPNGHQHGRDILTLLRQGPPWPALGALSRE
jgi:Ser/Thr protein kinase RdoA (MazF antagonist)